MPTARWYDVIVKALAVPENKGKVAYQVATIDSDNVPRVRTQIHRGFVTPKGAPHVPLFITSTDVRSPKVAQMRAHPSVEIVWWMEGSQDQFRIAGHVELVTSPIHNRAPGTLFPSGSALSQLHSTGAEGEDGNDKGPYDWEKKRREVFDAMRPTMRATWARPVAPGSVIDSYDVPKDWTREVPSLEDAKTEEDKKNWHTAFTNFVMMLIEPSHIDWVQMGEKPNRRTLFTLTEGKWKEEILAP